MKIIKVLSVMSLVLCLFAITSSAQSVQSDFDRSVDLSKLRTFTFAGEVRPVNRLSSADLMNDQRIMAALEKDLTANGYERKDSGLADFKVSYYVTTRDKVDLREYNYGPRFLGNRSISVDQYTEGTLIVEIVDTNTRRLVWRGRASGAVELKSVDKKITKSVNKIVEKFVKDAKAKGVK